MSLGKKPSNFLIKLDNSVTQLLDISSAEAQKKEHVFAKAFKLQKEFIKFDEPRLFHNILVRYLLNSNKLESKKRKATDCNWSFQIYYIYESLVQKKQPVLYWLIDDDSNSLKRSFVRKKLQIVPFNTKLSF